MSATPASTDTAATTTSDQDQGLSPNPDLIPDNTTTQTTPGIPPEMTYKDGDEFEDGGKPATHKTADPIAILGPKSQPDPIPPDPPEPVAPEGSASRMPNPQPLPDPSTFQSYPGSPGAAEPKDEEEEEEEEEDVLTPLEDEDPTTMAVEAGEGTEDNAE
jgi:hypothetical protein